MLKSSVISFISAGCSNDEEGWWWCTSEGEASRAEDLSVGGKGGEGRGGHADCVLKYIKSCVVDREMQSKRERDDISGKAQESTMAIIIKVRLRYWSHFRNPQPLIGFLLLSGSAAGKIIFVRRN